VLTALAAVVEGMPVDIVTGGNARPGPSAPAQARNPQVLEQPGA